MKLTDEMIEKAFEEWWESIQDKYQNFPEDDTPPKWFIKETWQAAFALLAPVIEKQSEALGFYGSRDSWDTCGILGKCMVMEKDMEDGLWVDIIDRGLCRADQEKFYRRLRTGGKRARQALAFVSEQLGKMGGEK